MQSLTTASESILYGSVVEHQIIDPAAWVRFPPVIGIFRPNLLCFVLCYGIHVLRISFLLLFNIAAENISKDCKFIVKFHYFSAKFS